ncbi:PilZ domain-containing protein [Marinicella meishanensis]|uniref:PilZ domain-containing protein n=1 Tax=Marinicella meishanensis TaxID=2873263 RepID=UPI001CBB4DD9|nr:PilZ domain-containing protein [Marinicella sp. NBU2979]
MNPDTALTRTRSGREFVARAPRYQPHDLMVVLDAMTDQVLGKVVNFSETGVQVLLRGDQPLPKHQIKELALVYHQNFQEKHIKVQAELLWSKTSDQHDMVLGGCYFCTKDFRSIYHLNQLIRKHH